MDGVTIAPCVLSGDCGRGVYDNLWTPPAAQDGLLGSAAWMRESICRSDALWAMMGIRVFWPRNMIASAAMSLIGSVSV